MKLGFIGCGNMAQAMMKGIISKGTYEAKDIYVSDHLAQALEKAKNELGVNTLETNEMVAKEADIVIFAVKPFHFEAAVKEMGGALRKDQLIISIAAGITIDKMETLFGKDAHIVRSMPNTPALVLEGAAGVCRNRQVTDDELQKAVDIFESFGIASVVDESMIDTIVGVSGSSPAYVFLFIEAMADAAVADGMPRKMAYDMAAQAVLGSAKMVLETGKHPGELKDMVCSPKGTTIDAVRVLEEKGFRGVVMDAQMACVKKARSL